jgi:hypothetical protein
LDVSQRLATAHADKLAALQEAHETQLKLQQQVTPMLVGVLHACVVLL